jgi:hypothetical protein
MADPSPTPQSPPESSFIDVQAWTEETIESIRKLRVTSSPEVVRRRVSLSIPHGPVSPTLIATRRDKGLENVSLRREADADLQLRKPKRDGMKTREALLRGKEGSRRRQKWENGKS